MEAFLLTLDVISLIGLCIVVTRVSRSGNDEDLGFFAYSLQRVRKVKQSFAEQFPSGDPHA